MHENVIPKLVKEIDLIRFAHEKFISIRNRICQIAIAFYAVAIRTLMESGLDVLM